MRRHARCLVRKQSFHSPSASESLSLASPLRRRSGANGEAGPEGAERRMRGVRESNQREGDPGIRAGRTSFVLFPAVLVAHRPANNSAIPGLRQFAFPRWSTPLLGATAGDPWSRARLRRPSIPQGRLFPYGQGNEAAGDQRGCVRLSIGDAHAGRLARGDQARPSAFRAACTPASASMRALKAAMFGKPDRSTPRRSAQRSVM